MNAAAITKRDERIALKFMASKIAFVSREIAEGIVEGVAGAKLPENPQSISVGDALGQIANTLYHTTSQHVHQRGVEAISKIIQMPNASTLTRVVGVDALVDRLANEEDEARLAVVTTSLHAIITGGFAPAIEEVGEDNARSWKACVSRKIGKIFNNHRAAIREYVGLTNG